MMPNGTGMEGHGFTDSEVRDLKKRIDELENTLAKQYGVEQSEMLAERLKNYGPFELHSVTVEALWRIIQGGHNAQALDSVHNEGLRMIVHKIGRIVTGNPFYADSWEDIAGYAKRVADYNRKTPRPTSAEPKVKYNPTEKLPIISEGEKDPQGFYKP